MAYSLRVVEQLSLINGVVVSVGYCDPVDQPFLVYEGSPLNGQSIARYNRADSDGKFGNGQNASGFRMAAIVDPEKIPDNSKLAVCFPDGKLLRRNLPNRSDAHRIFASFIDHVNNDPGSSLLEIGSRARSGNVYKTRFTSLGKYVGLDITDGPNVDIVGDAHSLSSVLHEKFDYAYSVSTFEHLMMPWTVVYELSFVIKNGGLVYIQSHTAFPLHDEPWDFFRFSENAWKSLFNKFTGFEIIETGYSLEANIIPLNANAGALQRLDRSKTFLVSACLAKKVAEPEVNWSCSPSTIADLQYTHGGTVNLAAVVVARTAASRY